MGFCGRWDRGLEGNVEHKGGGGEEARKALWRELDPRGLGNEDKDEPCEEVGL